MSDEAAYSRIQKKVKRKKGFYFHLGLYVIIILFLTIINWLTAGRGRIDWWVAFPAVSWGTVVAIHALAVFIFSKDGVLGEEWENKKIEREMNKRGYSMDKVLPAEETLDIDEHLELKEVAKRTNYNEQDLV